MLSLIDDMLNISKLENSCLDMSALTDIKLENIANEVANSLKLLSDSKNISVSVTGHAVLKAEKEHMFELIKNLAENAVRYNNNGGHVDISLSDRKDKTVISVIDNGIGIDAQHQGRIFERFYRVDKSRSRSTGGTGLGLSIVKHICELYNAEISLKSRLGLGTEITVSFPK